jgi:predicted DNA-binding WGR domain protein
MRRFEFVEGTSSKFWEADVSGTTLKICYGKIGTTGKAETKLFGSEAAAQAEADKLIREKTKKGYKEVAAAVPAAGAQDGK